MVYRITLFLLLFLSGQYLHSGEKLRLMTFFCKLHIYNKEIGAFEFDTVITSSKNSVNFIIYWKHKFMRRYIKMTLKSIYCSANLHGILFYMFSFIIQKRDAIAHKL